MGIFCLLWLPLFYLFWASVSPQGSGAIWALIPGSVGAALQIFLPPPIEPQGFGFARWAAILVDVALIPAVLPLGVCALFRLLRIIPQGSDLTGFTLLWLIPGALMRAVSRSAQENLPFLALALLIQTALAVGIPFFAGMIGERRPGILRFVMILPMATLPPLAAAAYWAFFSQRQISGALLLAALCIPPGIRVLRSCLAANRGS
jgi:hypothetical protein